MILKILVAAAILLLVVRDFILCRKLKDSARREDNPKAYDIELFEGGYAVIGWYRRPYSGRQLSVTIKKFRAKDYFNDLAFAYREAEELLEKLNQN